MISAFWPPAPPPASSLRAAPTRSCRRSAIQKLVDKLRTQKGITIHHDEIPRANHFFEHELDQLMKSLDNYLDMRLAPDSPIR